MKKFNSMGEAAWLFAQIFISLGVCLVTKGGFGVSMVVAPAYIIHLEVSRFIPWYSFGTSEYILQAVLLIIMCIIIKKFDFRYLLSFLTAVIYGFMLDGWFLVFGGSQPFQTLSGRIISLACGVVVTAFSISLFFRTYLPQQVYELFVSHVAERFKIQIDKFKWAYDIGSLTVAVILALCVSHFNDNIRFWDCIGIGTLVCTVLNAPLIALFGKMLDKLFGFNARFPRLENKLKN